MSQLIPLEAVPERSQALFMRLSGGLGNLLFQYLAGVARARALGVPHYGVPDVPMIHDSSLGRLGISLPMVRVPDFLMTRVSRRKDRSLAERIRSLSGRWPLIPVREPSFHYWSGFDHVTAGSILFGYWQSPHYFAGLESEILAIFDPAARLTQELSATAADLRNGDSVAVHVRRNDYARRPETLAVHGIMELTYYDRARAVIESKGRRPHFHVFSDEPTAAKALLGHWSNTTFMPVREQEIDMVLMSCCRNHIIANSTFSWWGAYVAGLRDANTGAVVAPRYWFTRETLLTRPVVDLMPETWILA